MRRQILFLCVLCFGFHTLKAQDPVFSQFYSAPLQLNPALAGNTYAPHFSLNYRNQWPSLNAYVTYAASYDQFLKPINSGIGLLLVADDAGAGLLKTNKLSGIYSYRVKVKKDFFIKMGIEASAIQTKLNWDQLIFFDQLDREFGATSPGGTPYPTDEIRPDNLTKTYFDISAGLLFYSPQFYAGLSIKHLNTPNEAILGINDNLNAGLPMRITIHGGAEITLSKGNKGRPGTFISPNAMFIKQGDFGQINVGAYLNVAYVFGGVWYRHAFGNSDAAIFQLGFNQGMYKIGYSYDLTVSGLAKQSGGTGGSHEISVTINLEKPYKVDYNDCLKIFR